MLEDALLRRVAIFGGLTRDQLALVFHVLDERDYAPGATVVEEGTSGRELFVIVEGAAEILKGAADGREAKIAELGTGACFGEMALVGIMSRAATVRARPELLVSVLP